MINFDHINAGVEVINEFSKRLEELCAAYDKKLAEACPENICDMINIFRIIRRFGIRIQLTNNGYHDSDIHYTEDELITNGFEVDRTEESTIWFKKEINGVNIVCPIHIKENSEE